MQIISTSRFTQPPLRATRLAKGLTLRSVARQADIDPGLLSKVERGQRGLSIESLHRLALALEMSDLASSLAPYLHERATA
ncbi:helix-turn-helix transcriptional regulator [Streptomyces sp. NPDC051994]|uniref:helix-turn-helix domain-containing protein n=1 Tax=unclassified Streptomyces TaxID=2593676 RepID=UPI003417C3C5